MLPTTLARGRATARGYGELLTMLNPATAAAAAAAASIPGLNTTTYRYSPYTIPTAAGSAAAAAAAAAAAVQAVPTSTVLNTVGPPTVVSQQSSSAAAAALAASAGAPHVATPGAPPQTVQVNRSTAGLLSAPTPAPVQAVTPANPQQQPQQLNLQHLQLLGLVGALPATTAPAGHQQNSAPVMAQHNTQLAAQILALNNQAVAAAAAANATAVQQLPCKQRAAAVPATLPPTLALATNDSNSHHHQVSNSINGLNYSMNDLINLQGLQQAFDASAAANFQVPVGL